MRNLACADESIGVERKIKDGFTRKLNDVKTDTEKNFDYESTISQIGLHFQSNEMKINEHFQIAINID